MMGQFAFELAINLKEIEHIKKQGSFDQTLRIMDNFIDKGLRVAAMSIDTNNDVEISLKSHTTYKNRNPMEFIKMQ